MMGFVKYLIGLNCLFAVVSAVTPSRSILSGNVHSKIEKLIALHNEKAIKDSSSVALKKQLVTTDDEANSNDNYSNDDYSADLDGYFYVSSYSDVSCSTNPIYSFGYRLEQCVTIYGDNLNPLYTVKGSCNPEQFTFGRYDSLDCSGPPSNATFGGINACDQGFEIGASFIALCSSGSKVPVHMNSVVIKGYEGADAETCSSEAEITVFEAFEQDTCIALDQDSSIKLQCPSTGSDVIDSVYNASTTCTSTHTDYPIVQECSAVGTEEYDYVASLLSFSSISGSSSAKASAPTGDDDTYPAFVNTTYLYQDISVECFYFTTSKPSSLPTLKPTTATPTMKPTPSSVLLNVVQNINQCTFESYSADPASYNEALLSTIVGSIPCIDSSMIIAFYAYAAPTAAPTHAPSAAASILTIGSEVTAVDPYFSITYYIETSDPSVSVSLIESQLDNSLNTNLFTNLLQESATTYNAPGLANAYSQTAEYTNERSSDDDNDDGSLSDGEIVGIVLGSFFFILIVFSLGYYFYSKSKTPSSSLTSSLTTGASSSHGATTNPMTKAYTPPTVN